MTRAQSFLLAAALAPVALGAAGSLETEIKAVAALPGEPHVVSAAGVTRAGMPLLTIENPSPFDPSARRRVVIVGGLDGDERAARAVADAVRWFKTSAPRALRARWDLSALPLGDPGVQYARRWAAFQAPDVVIEIRGDHAQAPFVPDGGPGLGTVQVVAAPAASADRTVRNTLTASAGTRSPLRDSVLKRVSRDPLDLARILAVRYPQTPAMSYIAAVSWVNALRLASVDRDDGLRTKVREQTQPWMSGDKPLFGSPIPLTAVAGTMIFAERASGDGETRARDLAVEGARLAAARKESGVAQYGQGWTDDMFMASAVLARTVRIPGREEDLDAAARLLVDYAARLQRADGVFIHAADGPIAWGRGNGFAALGLMEALTALPEGHPLRLQVLDIYRRQMNGVRAMQAPDGMWRQVIDAPGAYREETATAMLLAAMARGVRLGWIEKTYSAAIERAWRGLSAHVGDDGTLVDVCAGTGAGPTRQYYLERPAITGFDDRGGAMALLASMEMHELSRGK